ncbi:MAG: molybdenum cofactor biosynthesis protein MoaE [Verrucomicrobiales bacterium]
MRRDEGGRALRGIRYSAYVPMAEKTLRDIAAEARQQFGDHAALIRHRIGFVAVDEASGHPPGGGGDAQPGRVRALPVLPRSVENARPDLERTRIP